jgi:nitrogen fixation/metabolism regulation signal transduction histidine kinase
MADIANNVLHNVGNVLNSINTSVSVISEKDIKSDLDKLNKLSEIILKSENASDKDNVAKYLSLLSKKWDDDNAIVTAEIGALRSGIEYIKNIISRQQSLGKISGIRETVNITDIINEAILINEMALKDIKIDVFSSPTMKKNATLDHLAVLQIYINLIKNAAESIGASLIIKGGQNYKITIENHDVDGKCFSSCISDNGEGIPEDNIDKIFSHGFTTKLHGHGFGLHDCANSAQSMGGSLVANSAGLGHGASFILTLPYGMP